MPPKVANEPAMNVVSAMAKAALEYRRRGAGGATRAASSETNSSRGAGRAATSASCSLSRFLKIPIPLNPFLSMTDVVRVLSAKEYLPGGDNLTRMLHNPSDGGYS